MEQSIPNHHRTQHEAGFFNEPYLLVGSYRLHRGPRAASAPQYAHLVMKERRRSFSSHQSRCETGLTGAISRVDGE